MRYWKKSCSRGSFVISWNVVCEDDEVVGLGDGFRG